MLPDLSPAHILIVVIIALVVVGPKDLPLLLRKIGQFMGKMRGMANEFRASFDEMARQSELDELRKEVEAMRSAANAATPDISQLGITEAMKEAEDSYMAQWQTSQSEAEAFAAPEAATLGPSPPVMTGPQPGEAAPVSAPEVPVKAPAKPRTRKPKAPVESSGAPDAETGA